MKEWGAFYVCYGLLSDIYLNGKNHSLGFLFSKVRIKLH